MNGILLACLQGRQAANEAVVPCPALQQQMPQLLPNCHIWQHLTPEPMKTPVASVNKEPGQRWQCPKLLGTRRQLQPCDGTNKGLHCSLLKFCLSGSNFCLKIAKQKPSVVFYRNRTRRILSKLKAASQCHTELLPPNRGAGTHSLNHTTLPWQSSFKTHMFGFLSLTSGLLDPPCPWIILPSTAWHQSVPRCTCTAILSPLLPANTVTSQGCCCDCSCVQLRQKGWPGARVNSQIIILAPLSAHSLSWL